jgi:hypothetical protein
MSEHMTGSERFLRDVPQEQTPEGCLNWTGSIGTQGYGRFGHEGGEFYAHRTAFEMYSQKEIPQGLLIRHKCDNRRCVNPAHLELGTFEDNMNDKMSRGRQCRGERMNSAKLSKENVLEIRRCLEAGVMQKAIAKEFNVDQSLISLIKNRRVWGHL